MSKITAERVIETRDSKVESDRIILKISSDKYYTTDVAFIDFVDVPQVIKLLQEKCQSS